MSSIDNNSHDRIEQRIADIDWSDYLQRDFTPSPAAWEDQVLYFLMLDRFSDDREKDYQDIAGNRVDQGETPLFRFPDDAYQADREAWAASGNRWLGGNLKGLQSKLGYLKRMGVTAVWISPVFKQVPSDQHAYHGYGIQNFLDVDPHFGTRQALRELVDQAHALGIYVILDIIFNHAGDVFGYDADRYAPDGSPAGPMDPRWDGKPYQVTGFRTPSGETAIPYGPVDTTSHPQAWPDGAVWPAELQNAGSFTSLGRINSWDYDPEYLQGDFFTLKDLHHGSHDRDEQGNRLVDRFHPSPALNALCEIYKFWIAFADVDGFRVDTVKHMELGATRYFTSAIKEFAQSLGKENFYLIGEITGGRVNAFNTLEQTGLDAALGINDIPDRLEYLPKGHRNPKDYFDLFRNSILVNKNSHTWYGRHVVTLFDDHDQVRKGNSKARFCGDKANRGYDLLPAVLALNLTSMGIPCLYYGTEQAFDGAGGNDRFLRECMFGGEFGSLQSRDRHFFNEAHPIYRFIARVVKIRQERIALRRGRQYLRQISASGDAGSFGLPRKFGHEMRSLVPWSRIFNNQELLLAINTDADHPRQAWITIDNDLHDTASTLTCLFSTDDSQTGQQIQIEARNGKAVFLSLPPAGFVIFE
jgi:glycosidase